jgi:hypothetical protein
VNPPKIEFFHTVTRLEAGLTQFSNALGQRSQAISHRWFRPLTLDSWREQKLVDTWGFRPLTLDSWREQKLVDPWGLIMHIYKNLLGGSPIPAAS